MKTIILAVAVAMACSAVVRAQDREAPQLNLGELGWTGTDFDSVTAFDERPWLWGWNWLAADGDISATLDMNVWHLNDPYAQATADWAFGVQRTPGQLLIPTLHNITGSVSAPGEAISMEWQPWLVPDGDTMVLRADDSTGGVWGFFGRHAAGTVVKDGTDGCYRYRIRTADIATPMLVLWSVERKNGLSRNPDPSQLPGYNTDSLWLAVNLRRNDASIDSTSTDNRLDEPVLRVRVPMWVRDPCDSVQADSTLARFRRVPLAENGPQAVTSQLGAAVGTLWNAAETDLAPAEIVITRRMLPPLGAADEDITIYAMLVFDWDAQMFPANQGDLWRNPRFMPHNDHRPWRLIERVSINVEFTGELGVDIKSVRLESTEARELFWGQRDSLIRTVMRRQMDRAVIYNRDSVAVPGEQPRLWRIYSRDELLPMHWKGFRYLQRLLHDRTTTEWEIHDVSKAVHCLRLKEFWQGSTFRPETAPSPLVRHGRTQYGNDQDSVRRYLDIPRGRDDVRDLETFLHAYTEENCTPGQGSSTGTQTNFSSPLPLPDSLYNTLVGNKTTTLSGVLAHVEISMNRGLVEHPRLLFDTTLHVISNLWEFSSWEAFRDNGVLQMRQRIRAKSVEEMRLQQWWPIVLGSKGNIHYGGVTQLLPESALDLVGSPSWSANEDTKTVDVGAADRPQETWMITSVADARIDDDDLGQDTVLLSDRSRYDLYMPSGLEGTGLALHAEQPGDPGVPIYRKSMRQVIRETQRSLRPYTDSLLRLYMVAWRGQGFRRWFLGDTAVYQQWLRSDSAFQQVFVTAEQDPTTLMDLPRPEPYDSSFFDITLHRRHGRTADSVCYLGVLNRRTESRLDTTRWQDEVMTFDQLKAHMRQHPEDLFKQYGARRIRLPFHYTGQPGKALNLRVQELRTVDTTMISLRPPIDTVIGRDVPLDIDFLPGEGKMFRISTVPASNQQNTGYLTHSNQRKIVAFPVIDTTVQVTETHTESNTTRTYLRMVAGDTMRYHRVFHRRRDIMAGNPPVVVPEGGALTVYYQRSTPLVVTDDEDTTLFKQAFDASTISWELPVDVSSRVRWQAPGTEEPSVMDLSCGYPALVVRLDTLAQSNTARVYVVFGCEYEPETANRKVLVCETVLPANATSLEQAAYYAATPSEVLDVTPAPLIGGVVTTDNLLEHWGTPMVNASAAGNYYCWSHAGNGIGVGFKEPEKRLLGPGQLEYLRLHGGHYGSHPSMHSYSRLHIGEDDAGIVWQEGTDPALGKFILYTRLKRDTNNGNAIYHELCADATPVDVGPGIISPMDTTIAQLTDIYVDIDSVNYTARHAYPVLYRQLSDWTMTSANKFYNVGIVNYKAERAYWQTLPETTNPRWVIGRRLFDIAEWTARNPLATDTVLSHTHNFIFSDSLHLRAPDATQGEQWGEWGSDPEYSSWDHDDSTSVLEFFSETGATDPLPRLWHLTLSWALYGSDVDYDHADLVASGELRQLDDRGRYPHLASRYSMIGTNNRGWQRNRRIFNGPGGNWTAYAQAPPLWTSSQYFYKGQQEEPPQGLRYLGFRSATAWAVVAPIELSGRESLLPFRPQGPQTARTPTESFATEWLSLPEVVDISAATRALGEDPAARFEIERERDAQRFSMNAIAVNQAGATQRKDYTLLTTRGDRYRFIVSANGEGLWPAEDLEIRLSEKNVRAKGIDRRQILDLRTMTAHTAAETTGMVAYPNPAGQSLTLVVTTGHDQAESNPKAYRLVIVNSLGVTHLDVPCRSVDVHHLQVSSWPTGSYRAVVTSADGVICSTAFVVMR